MVCHVKTQHDKPNLRTYLVYTMSILYLHGQMSPVQLAEQKSNSIANKYLACIEVTFGIC